MPRVPQQPASSLIGELAEKLDNHRPRRLPGRRYMARCGVAAVLSERPEHAGLSVLLMRRASRSGDPWSGHMSFPGGRMDPGDRNTRATAMRETVEETGLMLDSRDCIGRLSDVVTRQHARMLPMTVTPHVFHMATEAEPQWQLNHEVTEIVWVPLDFFAVEANRKIMHWRTGRVHWQLPCFFYQERRIWGLTLLMLRELLGITHGVTWRSIKPVRGQAEVEDYQTR